MQLIDREAVAKGAAAAVVICLPLALVADAVVDEDDPSALAAALLAAVLLGFVFGGFVAGRDAPRAPYTNGALAALVGFAVIQATAIVVRLVGNDPVQWGEIVGTALLAYGSGLTGGLLADRNVRRRR